MLSTPELIQISSLFTFMPGEYSSEEDYEIDIEHKDLFYKIKDLDSVTFFGGTFNPFHIGHLECLKLCPESNIILIPDCNPQKIVLKRSVEKEIFELAYALESYPFSIYPGFFIKEKSNPTASWLPNVNCAEVNFLMGDDSFKGLQTWVSPELILRKLSKLYVVSRNYKFQDYKHVHEWALSINPKLLIVYLGEHPFMDVSSTKIRESN